MAYTPRHYYRAKDDLSRGDPEKRVRGSELSDEFEAISSDLRKVHDELSAEGNDLIEIHGEIDEIKVDINDIKVDVNDIKVDVNNNKTEINELRDDFENHDHALDDLSDVTSKDPKRDDLIVWTGQNWVSTDFAFIETTLRFKGGIDMTGPAPANPENGDLWVNDNVGTIDASWGEIGGREVLEGKFVGWAESTGRWHLLGDMASVGVTRVLPATGVTVDDSKPAEPVVGLDRDELDKWYADKGETNESLKDLEGLIQDNAGNISDLETNLGTLEKQVNTNTGDIFDNAGDIADLRDEFEKHDHALDDLSDVNANNPSRDELLVFNGAQWASESYRFIQTALTFKGGINVANAAPSAEQGDLYVNDTEGEASASWTGIAGTVVQVGNFIGYANSRWYLLGQMSDIGVTSVSPGTAVLVDDSKPAAPVVSVDKEETDKWYLSASFTESDPTVPQHVKDITQTQINNWQTAYGWDDHSKQGYLKAGDIPDGVDAYTKTESDARYEPKFAKNSGFNKSFGTTSGTVAQGNHTHSQYLTDYTETDPVFKASPAGGITSNDITNWNSVQKGSGGTVSNIKIVVGATGTDPNTLYFVV
jgi:predicted  nucleic acid-binding Zn-ribbon protein